MLEIYGSTETGGIGWRNQGADPASADWTPCDDVALDFRDGALVVRSFRAGPEPLRMEDAAEPAPEGRFRLQGRLDRTVKLEETADLPARAGKGPGGPSLGGPGRGGAAGRAPPRARRRGGAHPGAPAGRDALVRTLRAHLALRLEATALPRRWRFPRELPYDARGKLTPRLLAQLFQP